MQSKINLHPKPSVVYALPKKPGKIHWYDYNNAVPLSNVMKSLVFCLV